MIKVSVVVPVYNVKIYLDECMISLLNQTLTDIDIILVDDGSNDGSQNLCDMYAQKYESVRVIHKENGGLGSARNVGLNAAVGKYVYFIDSDDSLKKGALEELYKYAERDSLDVVMFSAECFSDELGINYNSNEYQKTQALNEVMSGKELFISLVDAWEYYASIPLRFYRTDYLQDKGYRFPEHIIHEDEFFAYWSLIQARRSLSIPDRFYNRRFRAGSIMTSKKAYNSSEGYIYTWKQMISSLQEITDWSVSDLERVIKIANNRLSIVANLYANAFDASERKRMKSELGEMREIVKSAELDLGQYRFIYLFLVHPDLYRIAVKTQGIKNGVKNLFLAVFDKLYFAIDLLRIILFHFATKKGCVVLIGTPTHGNLGDQAIVLAEKQLLRQVCSKDSVIEISSKNYLKYANLIQKVLLYVDQIIIDGGGSMGTLWINNEYRFRDVVNRFPNNYIYIFPQTIYFGEEEWEKKTLKDSKAVYDNHDKLTIFCRDFESFSYAKENFTHNRIIYMPDMVLSLYPQRFSTKREGKVLMCYRNDIEAYCNENIKMRIAESLDRFPYKIETTSTLTGRYIYPFCRKNELKKKWYEFASAKLVVTDRLHAMIFCALTGTPCIAIDNLSKKVGGTYAWIADLPYVKMIYCEEDVYTMDFEELISKADSYIELIDVKEKYKELKDIIKDDQRKN